MATIVYEGGGLEGGSLFEGLKFFIAQRVPLREHWIRGVKTNGGEVVKLEKQADYLIADHVKWKFAAPGSLSYTFLEESLKSGALADPDQHVIHVVEESKRPVGAGNSLPKKATRTKFTKEDDEILTKWVVKAERKGIPTKGNELFQDLAAKNPRHTFQSWRDRWIKFLEHRPRPEMSDGDDHVDQGNNEPLPKLHSRLPPKLRSHTASDAVTIASPQQTPIPQSKEFSGSKTFTDEDTALLVNEYDDILNIDESEELNAWQAWADNYPGHTAQQWRNYFAEYVKPRHEQEALLATEKKTTQVAFDSEQRAKPGKSQIIEAPESSHSTKTAEIKGTNTTQKENKDPALESENVFKTELSSFAQRFEVEVDFTPLISGRRIPLFRIWQTVRSEEYNGFDQVDNLGQWPNVAANLNFSNFRHSNAAQELRDCYGAMLADFEEFREKYKAMFDWYKEPSPTSSQERSLIQTQLMRTTDQEIDFGEEGTSAEEDVDNNQENDDDLDDPSSMQVPQSNSRKRGANQRSPTLSSRLQNKRQRIDKGKGKELEIPPTPEDTYSVQVSRPGQELSPTKRPRVSNNEVVILSSPEGSSSSEAEDEHEQVLPQSLNLTRASNPTTLMVEPETQDFRYANEEQEDAGPSGTTANIKDNSGNGRSQVIADSADDSSTQSQTESQKTAETQSFIEKWMAIGYAEEIVCQALLATSMEPDGVPLILEPLTSGMGIPEDMEGVWTKADDEALLHGSATDYRRIVTKHGQKRMATRRKLLAALEE